MIRDWFYAIDAYHPDGKLISVDDMEKRIRSIVWDVDRRLCAGEVATPVGILSSDERDRWAQVYYESLKSLRKGLLFCIYRTLNTYFHSLHRIVRFTRLYNSLYLPYLSITTLSTPP